VNFREIKDMKKRSKHFGGMSEFTYIAEIFISNSGGITTICGSRISREEVWIKVCNAQSEGQVRASETTDFEGGHPGAHLISIERHKERQ